MKHLIRLALGALTAWMVGWLALTIAPRHQLSPVRPPAGLKPYTAVELQGRRVYVVNGCLYCHSQQPRAASYGSDSARGWGRAAAPGDYFYDNPHQLGTSRTGPDLMNIGVRQPSEEWHLIHLYQPRAVAPGSVMPSFRFLFEEKRVAAPGDRVVALPAQWQPNGLVVVAKPQAIALVSYLRSLNHTYPAAASALGHGSHAQREQ